jgi:hypothetical protein
MDGLRGGDVGPDHVEIVISAQGVECDQLSIDKAPLAHVAKLTGQFHERIVGKLIWRVPRDDEGDVECPVEEKLRLLSDILAKRAAEIDFNLEQAICVGVDGVNEWRGGDCCVSCARVVFLGSRGRRSVR